MATIDNRYSRFVQLAKILFPLLALGLLSTLFLFSRTIDTDAPIPLANIDVEKIAREQRLASPRFSGVTSDGSAIAVTAESAVPDPTNPRQLSASGVKAEIKTLGGTTYDVIANEAKFDGEADLLDLMGNVSVSTSTGYTLETEQLVTNLQTTGLVAPGTVTGTSQTGQIEAGSMELIMKENTQLLVFKNGVKLVYQP